MFPNNTDDIHPLPNVAWVNDNSVVDEASMERNVSGIQENGQDSKQLSQVIVVLELVSLSVAIDNSVFSTLFVLKPLVSRK